MRRPEIELLSVLAENIRMFRHEKGLSQEALADLCSLHRTYIGSIERCERNVTLASLAVVAKALNVSVPELLTRREYENYKKKDQKK
ncbi:helix-turn-helix domain-containing protein [Caballeronia zhejiangensis]|uniref:helix-turn-helix domain-containing protein n=1 Tax=Caballeronia zhejiangensis TaxID=871203 RepID=UPI0024C06090|nr:helix-turn-helix transcriptional regulator [Caballeronia zhejiangensis]MCI1041827.1 helix-turn-helix transcriptional regulator [Caballeronia zhejiangensis]